jgi:hypothetical protein
MHGDLNLVFIVQIISNFKFEFVHILSAVQQAPGHYLFWQSGIE